ncbi:MAG: hypothetical protein JWR40_1641 [Massilia sp.]|nr:hypothetical protein [Massilia sp.]
MDLNAESLVGVTKPECTRRSRVPLSTFVNVQLTTVIPSAAAMRSNRARRGGGEGAHHGIDIGGFTHRI